METAIHRLMSAIMAGIFLLSTILTGTFGWQSLNQTALNEKLELTEPQDVVLIKLEKDAEPEKPLAGAVFYLFNAAGEQIGGRYTTDGAGTIHLELPPGDYYFEEQLPPLGYTFDQEDGAAKTRYPFTVAPGQQETVVRAYNIPLTGSLTVQKLVQNADDTLLTDAQKALAFTFTVTFSDGGTYTYRINGEGAPISVASGGQLLLRHGQTAVFEGIPVGVLYTVTETPQPGYEVSGTGHRGNISEEGNAAVFVNTYTPELTGSLTVTKEVRGEGADLNKEFTFTAVIGGETVTFPLKHGEEKSFTDLPIGTEYKVTETDYTADGYIASVKEYTGVITGQATVLLPFINIYDPDLDETGDLTIEKQVIGEGADPEKEFTFAVTFSDGGTYTYRINGEGEPIAVSSGGELLLKHGQTAVFEDIPAGVIYTVRETDAGGYLPEQSVLTGVITAEEPSLVIFRNHVPVKLSVTKVLAGEYPAADAGKEFSFTLIVDGEEIQFVLKPGETKEFELPQGARYEVIEADYFANGYIQSIKNGFGTMGQEPVEVIATNTFIGNPEIEIGGVKKWVLGSSADVTLPESITVLLKQGETVVDEKTVTPDSGGDWRYTFTAPKYDANGKEIVYTVEELPVDGFKAVYKGYDITNEYLTPVSCDPPVVTKYVEGENIPETLFSFTMWAQNGAPMPEGSADGAKTIAVTGSGEVEFGVITFTNPGVYTYIIAEQNGGEAGWTYDTAKYTLTVTVVEKNGKLAVAERTLEKNGEAAEAVAFTNVYTEPLSHTVIVQGQKIWHHGTNPAENRPESILVYIYADGGLMSQWEISAQDNWSYSFELPKYAPDGHEIVYTVDEEEVDGYAKQIDGYNLINTYVEPQAPDDPTPPGDPDDPTPPDDSSPSPDTGDRSNLAFWFALMILSLIGLIATLLMGRRKFAYVGKHCKRSRRRR